MYEIFRILFDQISCGAWRADADLKTDTVAAKSLQKKIEKYFTEKECFETGFEAASGGSGMQV